MGSWWHIFGRPATQPAKPAVHVETLEGRRLLSASMDVSAFLGSDAPAESPALFALSTPVTRAALKNVIGQYTGTIKIGPPYSVSFPADLNIKKQSGTGKISGTISSQGLGVTNFAFKGTIDQKGKFKTSYNKNGVTGSLNGSVTKAGGLKGTFAAKYQGIDVTGTFSFRKVS